jgi:DNA (cytosine-5)-methyltransferase 1
VRPESQHEFAGRKFISASLSEKRVCPKEKGVVVDLFCGAGGFSLGADLAKFQTAAAVDIDQRLTSSYKQNFPQSNLLHADIRKIGSAEILCSAKVKRAKIVGVIGGPPCQGFSLIGKRDGRDPRNKLIWHFLRIVRELSPRFFIMENVPGLLLGTAKTILDNALSELNGFEIVGPVVIDALSFGAATRRERVVVVGYKKAYVGALNESDIRAASSQSKHSVRDAIADLPEPADCDWLPYKRRATSELSLYARRARSMPASHLGSAESRERLGRSEVSGVRHTLHTAKVVKRFGRVDPGTTDPISRCPRLEWTEPAPTLRAGTGPDRGSYQSIRPIHPDADRVITVREAARLQGFPDWFQFDDTKWHSFRMIGNSVSPPMAAALLQIVSERLES